MRAIVKALPDYNYIYLADTARTPYGTRSKEQIYKFTRQAVDFLFTKDCEFIILACNTASSDALRKIQQEYLPKVYPEKRVLGVLIPAAELAAERTKNKQVGVIATEATFNSKSFVRELGKLDPRIKVYQQACPLLVPLIESGKHDSKATESALKKYLTPLKQRKIDTLILGCTHYGILRKKIKKILGPKIKVISEAEAVPQKLKIYLQKHKRMAGGLGKNGIIKFYSTDPSHDFQAFGSQFFGKPVEAQKAKLG